MTRQRGIAVPIRFQIGKNAVKNRLLLGGSLTEVLEAMDDCRLTCRMVSYGWPDTHFRLWRMCDEQDINGVYLPSMQSLLEAERIEDFLNWLTDVGCSDG